MLMPAPVLLRGVLPPAMQAINQQCVGVALMRAMLANGGQLQVPGAWSCGAVLLDMAARSRGGGGREKGLNELLPL